MKNKLAFIKPATIGALLTISAIVWLAYVMLNPDATGLWVIPAIPALLVAERLWK